jgi:hypothetical protein
LRHISVDFDPNLAKFARSCSAGKSETQGQGRPHKRGCVKVNVVKNQFNLTLMRSSFTGYIVLLALFVAVLMVSFAFNLRPEASEILSLTTMFGYLGLRRRLKKSRTPISAAA